MSTTNTLQHRASAVDTKRRGDPTAPEGAQSPVLEFGKVPVTNTGRHKGVPHVACRQSNLSARLH